MSISCDFNDFMGLYSPVIAVCVAGVFDVHYNYRDEWYLKNVGRCNIDVALVCVK